MRQHWPNKISFCEVTEVQLDTTKITGIISTANILTIRESTESELIIGFDKGLSGSSTRDRKGLSKY